MFTLVFLLYVVCILGHKLIIMTPYGNPNSGVEAYEIGADRISVKFKRGGIYTYTYASAGAGHIEEMKRLARNNRGLNTYITHNKPGFI